jgi:hypothetical protein
MGQGSGGDGRTPTTAPPPFDPQQFARDAELAISTVRPANVPLDESGRSTAEVPEGPPLHKRVRINVPAAELAWFDLSEAAVALAALIDGTKTLLEIIEGGTIAGGVEAVAQLHGHGLLDFEDE